MSSKNELSDIEQLIAEFEASDLRELQVRHGDFEVFLSKDGTAPGISGSAQPSAGIAPAAPAPVRGEATAPSAGAAQTPSPLSGAGTSDLPEGAELIRAPYLGTFYRSPKPGAPVYVDIGSEVSEETELCLVEVMKLFTSVRAGITGKVHAILAEDGAMVQADQPLFAIVPA